MNVLKKHALTKAVIASLIGLAAQQQAQAILGGFENADGYAPPFPMDVWSYDAGQTGGPIAPNTGRWQELYGSGNAGGDSQYVSQHGYGVGGANLPPSALAVRTLTPSPDGSYDQTLRYTTGADDLGVSPATTLISATVSFDLCPGITTNPNVGPDPIFNNVPAFTLSFGGTNAASGITIGFTDSDPANSYRTHFIHYNGGTYVSQPFNWSGHFDHVDVVMDLVAGTYDVSLTPDFNGATPEWDPGAIPQVMATGALVSNAFNQLDSMYFRTHTDPGNGVLTAGLEKSFLDNFSFSVQYVPEPSGALALIAGAGAAIVFRRPRCRRRGATST